MEEPRPYGGSAALALARHRRHHGNLQRRLWRPDLALLYARTNEIWAPEIRSAKNPAQSRGNYRIPEYPQVSKLPAFADVMATSPENRLLTGAFAPENFTSVSLTGNAFQFLGVEPVLGRTILPSDIKPNGEPEPVVVISYARWQRLFQGSPDAPGKTLTLNETPYTVIGVMPSTFRLVDRRWRLVPLRDGPTPRTAPCSPSRACGPVYRTEPWPSGNCTQRCARNSPKPVPRTTRRGFTTVLRNYMDITGRRAMMQSSLRLLAGAVGFCC